MSTIFEKRGVWYYQYTSNGKRRAKSLKTKDKQSAKRLQKIYDAKLEQRRLGLAPKKTRLATAVDDFLTMKSPTLKPRSIESYLEKSQPIKKMAEFVQQINCDLVSEYVQARQKAGYSNATINKELSILRGTLKYLMETRRIDESPVRKWPVLKELPKHPDRIGFYSIEEVEKLKEYFKGREFEGCFLFALYTGARRSELFAAQVDDVNFKENFIKIRVVKTASDGLSSVRMIALHESLKAYLKKNLPAAGLLFPETEKHHRSWPHDEIQKACGAIGIPYKRYHGLRHTAATYLLHAGVDLRSVMAIMGWRNLETAQRYLHHVKTMKACQEIIKLPY